MKYYGFMLGVILIATLALGIYWIFIMPNNNENVDLELGWDADRVENIDDIEDDMEDDIQNDENQENVMVDNQGAVYVGVRISDFDSSFSEELVFEIALDTHSVDLDQYDLAELSKVYLGEEILIEEGLTWKVSYGGGHHIVGILTVDLSQVSWDLAAIESIALEIVDLDNVPKRSFFWDLDSLS